jgi:Ca2+-transporting ATPase
MTEQPSAPAAAPSAVEVAWYSLSAEDALSKLGSTVDSGLSTAEAKTRLGTYGPNSLPAEKPPSGLMRFLAEYRNYMQLILLGAAVASLLIGQLGTGVLLIALTLVNATTGMIEEGRAASAMNALQSMTVEKVKVRRDGSLIDVDPADLVPGDVVPLAAGDRVPADGRIVSSNALQIDESALTGESTPAVKQVDALTGTMALGDQVNMAFENTNVTRGDGFLLITDTGSKTQVGQVATMLKSTAQETPPLAKQLNRLTIWIALAAGATMLVMFAVGLFRKESLPSLFDTAVALAIAAVPEALPTVVTVILSLGSVALAKRKAVVKSLASVETLGEVSAINSDKTGTLTMNQMTVTTIMDVDHKYTVTGVGYSADGKVLRAYGADDDIASLVLPYVVANDAALKDGGVVGDPLDGAFLVLAQKAGIDPITTRSGYEQVAKVAFDPGYKFSASLVKAKDDGGKDVVRAFMKGAVPALVARSTADDDSKAKIDKAVTDLESEGLRVVAAATKDLDPADVAKAAVPGGDLVALLQGITLCSLSGMIDPPRASSKDAVQKAQEAHIQVRMVTGDDVTTAAAVAKQLGIPGKAITGADLGAMSDEEALAQIDDIGVIARVAPADKERLVRVMQQKGYVVAATGDGVNDAPALKAADIGVAMGTGTDVAKESGRMILEDDDFATIIYAVEQGRALYDNLLKYVRFILITLVAFVATFLFATILNIAAGQPFTAAQILWINFFIDAALGMALGFDKEAPGIMKRKPVARGASIITPALLITCGGVGLVMAAATLAILDVGASVTGSTAVASGMALTAFGFFRIVSTWQSRSATDTAFTLATFNNKQINWIVLATLVVMVLGTEFDFLQRILGTASLSAAQWLICLGLGLGLFLLWEIGKFVARRMHH